VLFGVEPSAAQTDYGWITLDPPRVSAGVQRVVSFVEKPRVDAARRLLSSGAVWNTMVIVARARALIDLCREHLPDLTAVFVGAVNFPPLTRDAFLVERYPHLQAADFSRAVLTPAVNLLAYTWPATIGWSDLGTPERLHSWLQAVPVEPTRPSPVPVNARRADEAVAAT
jgi:mannose-1-phosphate guanylyltransferase